MNKKISKTKLFLAFISLIITFFVFGAIAGITNVVRAAKKMQEKE